MFHNVWSMMGIFIYTVPGVLIAISAHEFAHGYMSARLGDPTPGRDGRLTLNPFRHLDLAGTLCLIFFHMGWAKPVRVNPGYYKNPKRDMILVALAGPAMNFVLAFFFMMIVGLIRRFTAADPGEAIFYVYMLAYYSSVLNVGLGVFNLIPVPPLDGSAVVGELIPGIGGLYRQIRPYAPLVLLLLLWTGILGRPLALMNNGILDSMWFVVRRIVGIGFAAKGIVV